MPKRAFGWFVFIVLPLISCVGSQTEMPSAAGSRFEEFHAMTDDGVQLYGRLVGTGSDTVIIPLAVYLAKDLLPLADGRTLIFYDPRSRGASDYTPDPQRLGMDFELADLEAVRAHFGVQRFSLIGWSYMGALVALYAADFPQYVRSVVQIGPMAPRRETSQSGEQRGSPPNASDLEYLAGLQQEGLPSTDPVGYCREWARVQMLRPMMGRPDSVSRTQMDPCIYWNEWPDQLFPTIRKVIPQPMVVNWDYTGKAVGIQAPVLIVHGTQDPNAAVEGGRDWASLLPNGRLLELDGVGHGPWLEAPEEFFRAVDEFLREH